MTTKPPFPARNNSYRNVILAFGGDDDLAATPPLPSTHSSSSGELDLGCSNPVTSGPLADSECWWEAGGWPPKARKPATAVSGGLMPIDERLEDLYAAAKQQQRWLDSQKSVKAGASSSGSVGGRRIARSKSSRMRGGIDHLIGCRDWRRREAGSRVVVPEHLLNVSADSLSDSASSTTVSFHLTRNLALYVGLDQRSCPTMIPLTALSTEMTDCLRADKPYRYVPCCQHSLS